MNSKNNTIHYPSSRSKIAKIKEELIEIHGPKCAYCGIDVSLGRSAIDYYYPRNKYPDPPIENNFILVCPQCNVTKLNIAPVSDEGETILLHPYSDRYRTEITFNTEGFAVGHSEAAQNTINALYLNRPELVAYRKDHIGDYIDKLIDDNSAYDVYKCSIDQIHELLQMDIPTPELQEYFRRMVYANVIASMEAYLSKTFITIVLNDETMFWRFVKRFDWNKEKVGIESIKEVYDNLNIKVRTKLAEVLYHNLPKVKAMYQKILEIDILQSDDEMTFLSQSVDIRHDLVHRNGRKNSHTEKDEFHSISADMITELISHVDLLVADIEHQIAALGYPVTSSQP